MVEILEDNWCKIKSFKTAPSFNLDADSFIIKNVVFEYVVSIGDGYIEQRNVFKFVDDIIHSKRFLNFQIRSKLIKKENDNFLIYIDDEKCPDVRFKKHGLYKCDILIYRDYNDDYDNEYEYGRDPDWNGVYTHVAELKYCEPLNDENKNVNTNTQNSTDDNDSIADHNFDMPLIITIENDLNINKTNNNMNEIDINIHSDETTCINDS